MKWSQKRSLAAFSVAGCSGMCYESDSQTECVDLVSRRLNESAASGELGRIYANGARRNLSSTPDQHSVYLTVRQPERVEI